MILTPHDYAVKLLLLSAEAISDFHLHNLFFSYSELNIQASAPLLHNLLLPDFLHLGPVLFINQSAMYLELMHCL